MRILMITNHLPYPPISGAPLRIFNLLRRCAMKHEVWVASLIRSSNEKESIQHLLRYCQGVETVELPSLGGLAHPIDLVSYLMTNKPPELRLYHSDEFINKIKRLIKDINFDIIDIEDSFMGLYLEALPINLQKKTVLTFHDVVFSKYQRISKLEPKITRKLRKWLYSISMRSWEPFYAERFGRCIAVSESDRKLLLSVNPRLKIDVVPNGVDTDLYKPLPCSNLSPNLIFVGNMAYRPNIDAMTYFCKDIFPKIREKIPNIEMWIVGINPASEVVHLAGESVHVTGKVEDLLPYYDRSTVCVVPLRAGGGTRLKIMEAMALGRPVVSTSIGCEGLDVVDGEHLFVADTSEQFINKTLRLIRDEELRRHITSQARELVVTQYDWNVIAHHEMKIFEEIVGD
jgi:polysaccharide biosynthesis protein PslH